MMISWLMNEESGQGMVEYGLILALVAIAVIGALTGLGSSLREKFTDIQGNLDGAKSE